MTYRTRKHGRPATAGLVALLALLLASGASLVAASDRQAPIIVVLPAEATAADADLRIAARIQDESGVAEATAWVKGVDDADYRPLRMSEASEGRWVAVVPPSPTRGERVTYYIEATDRRGQGPRRSGSLRAPFVAEIDSPAEAAAPAPARKRLRLAGVLLPGLAATIGGAVWWTRRRRSENGQEEIPPVAEVEGVPSIPAESLKALFAEGPPTTDDPADAGRREIEEQVFWMHLLAPALELEAREAEPVLRELALHPHVHPFEGPKIFDLATLRARLEHCREIDPWQVVSRWKELNAEQESLPPAVTLSQATSSARGASLVEALIAMAVMGIALGLSAISFDTLERPVRRGSEMMLGEFRQARALAMATTTPHRVRAASASRLVIETASSCASGSWSIDDRFSILLPDQVTLQSSGWTVCFDPRGTASTNLTATLTHPRYKSRSVEVLVGGAARPVE